MARFNMLSQLLNTAGARTRALSSKIILPVPVETDFCGVDLCVFVLVILCISRYQINLELIQDHVVEL